MTAKRRERFASETASEGSGEGRRRRRYVGHVNESCYKERGVGDAVVIAAGEYPFEERSSRNECVIDDRDFIARTEFCACPND